MAGLPLVWRSPAATASVLAALRPAMTTRPPWLAMACAAALPMPLVAPVMRVVLLVGIGASKRLAVSRIALFQATSSAPVSSGSVIVFS